MILLLVLILTEIINSFTHLVIRDLKAFFILRTRNCCIYIHHPLLI